MTPLGPIVPPMSVVGSAAGSFSTGAAERVAKSDVATHSLAAGQRELSSHPLDTEANASPDRDADGWTGGPPGDEARQATPTAVDPATMMPAHAPRLPDDPRGGHLDLIA